MISTKILHTKPMFGKEEANACYKYMLSGGFVTEFSYTKQLEKMIEKFIGAKHCIMTCNGTISLVLAFLALKLQAGDEIIIPNLTMIATLNATILIGLKPIFVDVTKDTLTLDVISLNEFITPKTKAIVHVSLNGKCENMSQLRNFCDHRQLHLIEDAAQSFGSFHKNKHIGTFGHIGSFSFSIPKIISTGQGGALTTNDDYLADRIRKLKDFGRSSGGEHNKVADFGINAKFTDIQAVIGIEQMKKINYHIIRKKEIWKLYYDELSNANDIKMLKQNDPDWVPWIVDIYIDNPDMLCIFLKEKGIDTRRQYPVLLQTDNFPVSINYSSKGLWLPSFIDITDNEIRYICNCINEYFKNL